MTQKIIKSGGDIVKEFIQNLEKMESLDREVVEAITALYSQNKLTQTKLQQILQDKRKVKKNG